MSAFKVGQRVRVVGQDEGSVTWWGCVRGREATIVAIPFENRDCGIEIEGDTRTWRADFHRLAPLTDPKADAFIESIKKLKPYEEPVVVKGRA